MIAMLLFCSAVPSILNVAFSLNTSCVLRPKNSSANVQKKGPAKKKKERKNKQLHTRTRSLLVLTASNFAAVERQ